MKQVKLKSTFLLTGKTLLLGLLLAMQPVHAERVEGLYTVRTLVPDASDATRAATANKALVELLVRVSGTRQVLEKMPPDEFVASPAAFQDHPQRSLWRELQSAQTLVTQFSYGNTSEVLTLETGDQVRAQLLELEFDPAGVNRLLRRLEAPVWDVSRPRTLFWVALEGRQGRYLISSESNQPLSDALLARSRVRGVPVVVPDPARNPYPSFLMSDVWNGVTARILEASQTYRPDAIVVARIFPEGGQWLAEWQLFTGMDSIQQRSSADTLGGILEAGVDFAAEALSQRYASQPGQDSGRYRISVANIVRATDYAALTRYLNGLSLTSQVRVRQVNEQQLLLELTLQGGLDQLRANLALDGRLHEESFIGLQQLHGLGDVGRTLPVTTAGGVDAYFRWQAR